MPELPEIETIRRSLEPHLVGRYVRQVSLRRKDVIHGAADDTALLAGCRISRLARHGKQLAVISESKDAGGGPGGGLGGGRVLCVHLGMSGSLRFYTAKQAATTQPHANQHAHVHWRIDGREEKAKGHAGGIVGVVVGGVLVFHDPRRFGGLWTYANEAALLQDRWKKLGEDALTITPARLGKKLAGTRRAVKAALLDQTVVAGLGNIYVDEALFGAKIHPMTQAAALSRDDVRRLVKHIRQVLRKAIDSGGSTLRDYVSGNGDPGRFQIAHAVYGRAGKSCVRCARLLEMIRIGGRSSVFCPACQAM